MWECCGYPHDLFEVVEFAADIVKGTEAIKHAVITSVAFLSCIAVLFGVA